MYSPVRITGGAIHRNQFGGVAKQIIQPIEKFLRQSKALVPRPASLDLPAHESVPVRLNVEQLADRDTLHLGDGLADLKQARAPSDLPAARATLAYPGRPTPRDDEIRPSVALAFEHDFGDRHIEPSTELRQRTAF